MVLYMDQKDEEFIAVPIPTTLFKKIEVRMREAGFASVSSYVTFVLKEILSEDNENEETVNSDDAEQVKARLKSLGYLD
jgi:hypothetical protein